MKSKGEQSTLSTPSTRTILITGASSGIGKETAELFQDRGWNVVATMRDPKKDEDLHKLDNVLVTCLDVTDGPSIQKAVKAGIDRFGRIDVLLNNAGYGAYGPLEGTPVEKIKRQFDTNVIGVLETAKAVIPHFRANGEGVLINVSSIGGKITFPLGTLYHGTKFAVEGLSEALSFEMATIGVRVKIIEPGIIRTNFSGSSFNFNNEGEIADYQELVKKVFEGFKAAQASASEPTLVAEVIYRAATDGTDQLRYTASDDARDLVAKRNSKDDATLLDDIRRQFKIEK